MTPRYHLIAVGFLALSTQFAFGQKAGESQPTKNPLVEDYEKTIKDLQRVEGSLNLYWSKKQVYLELPESKLGKLFQVQVSFATALDSAFMHAGMPVGGQEVDTFRFDRNENSVWLIEPTLNHRWEADDPFSVGTKRSFPEAILSSFRIEQQNPDRHLLLINITSLFYGDLFKLPEQISQMLGGPYMLDREKSGVDSVKGFPNNSVVQMGLHFMSPRGSEPSPLAALLGFAGYDTLEDSRSAPVKIDFNLWFRPDSSYRARLSDPRIGYFEETYFSMNRFLNQDRTERIINRWNLEKKDPVAPVSEPIKPIVWTIDPSIPAVYRPAVKEGILRWNKAFAALGFKDAIQVTDAPIGDPNYDHADGRRNVVRMMVGATAPFGAISQPRVDPISGEILNASITIDANVVRDMMLEQVRAQAGFYGAKSDARSILLRGPEIDLFATSQEQLASELAKRAARYGWKTNSCLYAAQMAEFSTLAFESLSALPTVSISKEDFVKRFLADMVCHEMGHCLGLRHNFAGSTQLTTAQLADDAITSARGVSSSVMDYTPINVPAVLKGSGNFYSPTIGEYDMWAVEYGYKPIDAKTTLGERPTLLNIASKSGLPGHAYASDEDASGDWNPYAVRFDCASDPVNFSFKSLQMLDRVNKYAIQNLPKAGQSYSTRTAILMGALSRIAREGKNISRFIGGVVSNRNFKGDQGEKPTVQAIDASTQRQARNVILQQFLSEDALRFAPEVASSYSTDENGNLWTAPLREYVGSIQTRMLASLMSANAMDRIIENGFKVRKNGYSVGEHYRAVTDSIFAEVGTNRPIQSLRRDLQKFMVDGMIAQNAASSSAIPNDIRLVTGAEINRVLNKISAQLASPNRLDEITILHLKDLRDTIVRYQRRSTR